jgi:hypothetical protein
MKFTFLTYRKAYKRALNWEAFFYFCCPNRQKWLDQMVRTNKIADRAYREGKYLAVLL